MDQVAQLLGTYGYPILFGLGLVEFLGVPVATAPVLIVVGASAAAGSINPLLAILAVTAGGLLGETTWYSVARWRGDRLLSLACGLASNPAVCILGFAKRVRQSGATVLLVAKFLPAGGSVPAFAAGLAGTAYRRFLILDAIAVLLWSGAYVLAGALFEDEVYQLLDWAAAHKAPIIEAAIAIVLGAVVWRVVKTHRHRAMHAAHADEWPVVPD